MYGYNERTSITRMCEYKAYKQISLKTNDIVDSMFVMKKEVDGDTAMEREIIACVNGDKIKQKYFEYKGISSLQVKAKEKVYRFEYAPPNRRYAYYVIYRKDLMYVFSTYIWCGDKLEQYFAKELHREKEFNTAYDLKGIEIFQHNHNDVECRVVDHATLEYTLVSWGEDGFDEKHVQAWLNVTTKNRVLAKKVRVDKQEPTYANGHNKSSYKDKYRHVFTLTLKDANVQEIGVNVLHEIVTGASNRYSSNKIKVHMFKEEQKVFFIISERDPKVIILHLDDTNLITRVDDPTTLGLWRGRDDLKKKWVKKIPKNVSNIRDFVGYKLTEHNESNSQ
jgi:hypothetical protein